MMWYKLLQVHYKDAISSFIRSSNNLYMDLTFFFSCTNMTRYLLFVKLVNLHFLNMYKHIIVFALPEGKK